MDTKGFLFLNIFSESCFKCLVLFIHISILHYSIPPIFTSFPQDFWDFPWMFTICFTNSRPSPISPCLIHCRLRRGPGLGARLGARPGVPVTRHLAARGLPLRGRRRPRHLMATSHDEPIGYIEVWEFPKHILSLRQSQFFWMKFIETPRQQVDFAAEVTWLCAPKERMCGCTVQNCQSICQAM